MTSRLVYARPLRCLFTTAKRGNVCSIRLFQSTSTLYHKSGLKESSTHDPEYTEHLKAESLRHQKEGTGRWCPNLASDSEEAVRADRDPTEPPEMQKRTTGQGGESAQRRPAAKM